jgi:catechol 2,3-dioxygenase-like lactoylglutathione lyase family enzyme
LNVVYRVRDLEAGRSFYRDTLGFEETFFDEEGGWARYDRGGMEILVVQGEPEDGGVATVDVADVKAEASRLKAAGVEVGVVLELHGQMRLVDVFDHDGNRLQLAQELSSG